ncbi:hypothetical protein LEQ_1250c [Ligilactobacillus equi DPC 6820]|uniref:Uncharacterized protein n=1 Tax=Ligilactobacillus equi DPC 6820 TaxID=1392007 RepID=V7HT66_9LACO|nr:hypothetical protein LEQ_1250c [Ligilactobacillus equi DPC 6820]
MSSNFPSVERDGGIFVKKITSHHPLISEMEPYIYFQSRLDGFKFYFESVGDAKDDVIFKTFYSAMSQTILTILNLWIEILWLGKKNGLSVVMLAVI